METTKIKTIIEDLEKSYDFNDYLRNYVDEDEIYVMETVEEIVSYFRDLNEDREITDTEVIYYANAIEYLKENDQSLAESIEIASDMWYETKDINSELLASLLKSQNNMEDYNTFLDELETELEKLID